MLVRCARDNPLDYKPDMGLKESWQVSLQGAEAHLGVLALGAMSDVG